MSKINGIGIGVSYGNSSGIGGLIDSSTFYAPLETSLILQRGTGDPTWSRATKAWGFNELGYLEELASGCAFFGGARLVRNLLRGTEDSSNVAWSKSTGSTGAQATDSSGGNTALLFSYTSSQSHLVYQYQSTSNCQATYCFSFKFKTDSTHDWWRAMIYDGSSNQCRVWFNAQTGAIGTASGGNSGVIKSASITDSGGGWFTLTLTGSPGITTLGVFAQIGATDADNSSAITTVGAADALTIERPSLVDVTNYDASYVPEYVSVGAVTFPYFGAGIDGAKYFNTGWNGAPLTLQGFRREAAATNNLLWSRDFPSGLNTAKWVPSASGAEQLSSGTIGVLGTATAATYNTGTGVGTVTRVDGSNQSYVAFSYNSVDVVKIAITNTGALDLYLRPTGFGIAVITIPGGQSVTGYVTGYANYYITTATGTGTFTVTSVKNTDLLIAKTATGLDGIANTATTLTATAADATILQPITLASAARCASAYVKRRTGTGTISFTQDGGSTWTDITAQINSSTWSRVQITSTLANPSTGFKISTSGDEIDVDCVQNEAGAVATSPIVTTTATVTRNAESLSYQTASNIDFAVGTLYGEIQTNIGVATRYIAWIGTSYSGLIDTALTSWRAYDGTTIANKTGLSNVSSAKRKRVVSWGGAGLTSTGDGLAPETVAFDGSFGDGATIAIGTNANGYIGSVAIYNYQMTDAQLQAITS